MTTRLMVLVFVLGAAVATPAQAATTVTNCSEYLGPGGLEEALSAGGEIVFACDGMIAVEPAFTINIPTSLDAAGHDVTLTGSDRDRLFTVGETSLILRGLAITGARGSAIGTSRATLTVERSRFFDNRASSRLFLPPPVPPLSPLPGTPASGGAINAFDSTVFVTGSEFIGNIADDLWPRPSGGGGAISAIGGTLVVEDSTFDSNATDRDLVQAGTGSGGAILSGAASTVVRRSTFRGNQARTFGGAIGITEGSLEIEDSVFQSNAAWGIPILRSHGGAISSGAPVALRRSEFSGNSAGSGGAVDASGLPTVIEECEFDGNTAERLDLPGGEGGALLLSGGPAEVKASTFSNNRATFRGGAIKTGPPLTVSSSTFDANRVEQLFPDSATGGGGAIHGDGPISIEASSFTRNEAHWVVELAPLLGGAPGGAVRGEAVSVRLSTFSANEAGGNGGAIAAASLEAMTSTFSHNTAGGSGGAIQSNEASLVRSTVAFNVAGTGGGGTSTVAIEVENSTYYGNAAAVGPESPLLPETGGGALVTGSGSILNTTLADNAAGGGRAAIETFDSLTITNSIVAVDPAVGGCRGPVADGGHNIDSGSTCGFSTDNFSKPATDPRLRGLGDNGGPTRTVSLYADSPAIDAGDDALCPLRDQRNRPRVGACDIGSFERQ